MNAIKSKTLLASAVLSLATAASPVQAELFAFSKLDINNFEILGSNGNRLDAGQINPGDPINADFSSLTFTSSADMGGILTGTGGFDFNQPNGDDIDFPASCLSTQGDCNNLLPENSLPLITVGGATERPTGLDYAAADQEQNGSPIDNLFKNDGTAFSAPANVGQIAVGNLTDTAAAGTANVNNGLEAIWTFSLAQAGGITFEGDVETYLEAFSEAGEEPPGKASAGTFFEITITDIATGAIVFDAGDVTTGGDPNWDLFNQTTSASANALMSQVWTCGDFAALFGCGNDQLATSFSLTTDPLLAENLYQLSIRSNANMDIARVMPVPEPGFLGMLGLGLLGLFLGRRRRA